MPSLQGTRSRSRLWIRTSGAKRSASASEPIPGLSSGTNGCRTLRGLWTRLPGARRAPERSLTGLKLPARPGKPVSSLTSRSEDSTGVLRHAGETDALNTTPSDPPRAVTKQGTRTLSLLVCEVCQASSCLITRRPEPGTKCLCTEELHVPLDRSDNTVSLHHECASCTNGRFVEIEHQRKRRVGSALFADAFAPVVSAS